MCIKVIQEIIQSSEILNQSFWVAFQKDWFGVRVITPRATLRLKHLFVTPKVLTDFNNSFPRKEAFLYLPSISKGWWLAPDKIAVFWRTPFIVADIPQNQEQQQVLRQHPDYKYWLKNPSSKRLLFPWIF